MLIAAAELLRPKSESIEDQRAATAASNIFVGTGIENRVVCSVRILDGLLRQFPLAEDPRQQFQRAFGMSISEYQSLCLSAFLNIVLDQQRTGAAVADGIDVGDFTCTVSLRKLVRAGYSRAQIESFLCGTSRDIEVARREARTPSYETDLTFFRKWPLLKTGSDDYLVMDSGFLLDKLYMGPFLTLIDQAEGKDRLEIRKRQGPAVEGYVMWLLSNSIDPTKENVVSSPRFLTNNENEEICDIALYSRDTAVLIECKGCFLSLESLEGLDSNKLDMAVGEKLGKGARQLAKSIARLYGARSRENTSYQSLRGVRTVYPVLFVRDEIADSFVINDVLNESFQSSIKATELSVTVRPLVCLSNGVLQHIAAFLSERKLSELLEDRLGADPTLQLSTGALFSRYLRGYGRPCHAVEVEFDRIAQPLMERLIQTPVDGGRESMTRKQH